MASLAVILSLIVADLLSDEFDDATLFSQIQESEQYHTFLVKGLAVFSLESHQWESSTERLAALPLVLTSAVLISYIIIPRSKPRPDQLETFFRLLAHFNCNEATPFESNFKTYFANLNSKKSPVPAWFQAELNWGSSRLYHALSELPVL